MGSRDAVCSEYQGRTFFVFLSSRRADRHVEMLVKMHDGFVISQNAQWEVWIISTLTGHSFGIQTLGAF